MKITKSTKISKIVDKKPKLASLLMTKYGLHCVGCFGAPFETLEEGARAHGMTDRKIEKMISELNKKLR